MNKTFHCPNCSWNGFPGFVLDGTRLRAQCKNPECLFTDRQLGPADFSTGIATSGGGQAANEGFAGKTVTVVDMASAPAAQAAIVQPVKGVPLVSAPPMVAAPSQAVPAAPQPVAAPAFPSTSSVGAVDVVAAIEARAVWLESEEARLEGVRSEASARLAGIRAERKRLQKMLHAGREQTRSAAAQRGSDTNGAGAVPLEN